jgi:hypothetical protein
MFQYSTETIINSNNGNVPVGGSNVRYAAVTINAATTNGGIAPATPDSKGEYPDDVAFLVDGVGLYHKKNIKKVTLAEYVPENNEIVAITIPAVTAKETLRLAVYTSQEGLSSSTYADAQLFHKKPFFYEIEAAGTAATDAQTLCDLINKEMRATDFNYFKASVSGAVLTLTADDCYTRFQKIHLATVELAANMTGWEDFKTVAIDWVRKDRTVAGKVALTPGTEGAGTVKRLIKNLRVPTDANTNVFGIDTGGKPIPNGQYNQIVIEYVTERRHIGGQVMGAIDNSITTHVFFVESAIAKSFKEELEKVYGTIPPADIVANPRPTAVTSKVGKPVPGSKQ